MEHVLVKWEPNLRPVDFACMPEAIAPDAAAAAADGEDDEEDDGSEPPSDEDLVDPAADGVASDEV